MTRRDDFTVIARDAVNRRYPIFTDAALTTPADLTDWTAAAQVRSSTGALLHSFTCVVELNAVRIVATPDQTLGWLGWPGRRALWDVVLTESDGTKHAPVAGGAITVTPIVTAI